MLPDGQPNPNYDPVRAFWLAPSWSRLEAYGVQLGEALKARTGTPAEKPTPAERPAAASFTAVPRSLAGAISPTLSGALFAAGWISAPLVACGVLKICYDLTLWWSCRGDALEER